VRLTASAKSTEFKYSVHILQEPSRPVVFFAEQKHRMRQIGVNFSALCLLCRVSSWKTARPGFSKINGVFLFASHHVRSFCVPVSHFPCSGSCHTHIILWRLDPDPGYSLPMRQPAWPANASSRQMQANTDDEHIRRTKHKVSPGYSPPAAVRQQYSQAQGSCWFIKRESPPIGFTSTCSGIAKNSQSSWRRSFSPGAQPDGRIFPIPCQTGDFTACQVPRLHTAAIPMD
jgi:hypothetical protein